MTDATIEVLATASRMALLTDARDWSSLVNVFADPVDVDYTSLDGGEPVRISSHELVDQWRDSLSRLDATQHLIGSAYAEINGDTALVTCAVTGTHRRTTSSGGQLWTVGGHYDIAMRRDDGWQISSLRLRVAWATGNRAIMRA